MHTVPNQAWIDGLIYKLGIHNKPFVFVNGGWMRSNKTVHEVERAIRHEREKSCNSQ